jgi:hypothetical protein
MSAPEPVRVASPGWLRRNRWALISLVLLIPLAVLASSFRMINVYLPWTYHARHASSDGRVHLQQTYNGNERDITIDVTASLFAVDHGTTFGKISAVPGSTLWKVSVSLYAEPDVILNGCSVWLVDGQEREYGTEGGKTAEYSSDLQDRAACVPKNAPGPKYDYFSNAITPSEVTRPPSWCFDVYIAVPSDVKPTKVRLGWHEPDYVELELP